MSGYSIPSLERLIEQFERLPSIGRKSATRLAYHILSMKDSDAEKFTDAITEARKTIRYCRICCNLTDREVCRICTDEKRDRSVICVVQDFRDVLAFEKTRNINVTYHVLQGVLSPMHSVTPDQLRIKELLARLKDNDEVKEVIMALDGSVEGEATAMYLSKLIKPLNIKVTRIGYGIPVGADLEYADEVTLSRSLEARMEI